MALADLMKKGFLTSATVTVATVATPGKEKRVSVATVAGVAVTKGEKSRVAMPTVATVAGVAVTKLPNTKIAVDAETLAKFRFDLLPSDIATGQCADELQRVNNMAWEFMTADGMSFTDAIRCAAEIVVSCNVAACEAAYADVQALWRQVVNSGSAATRQPPTHFS